MLRQACQHAFRLPIRCRSTSLVRLFLPNGTTVNSSDWQPPVNCVSAFLGLHTTQVELQPCRLSKAKTKGLPLACTPRVWAVESPGHSRPVDTGRAGTPRVCSLQREHVWRVGTGDLPRPVGQTPLRRRGRGKRGRPLGATHGRALTRSPSEAPSAPRAKPALSGPLAYPTSLPSPFPADHRADRLPPPGRAADRRQTSIDAKCVHEFLAIRGHILTK